MATHLAKCPRCRQAIEYDDESDEAILCPKCGVSLSPPRKAAKPDPLIGQSLGEFQIAECLGRGGMGSVYKARQASLDRFVALKVLQASGADEGFVQRFGREARSAAAVNHPNIIEIYAVGQDRGYQYIAMELVDGETLGDLLKREGRLPAERALPLFKQAAAALAKAHAAGILHRDVKPSNLLLSRDGLVKVADFGLAKRIAGDVSVTMAGRVVGTATYMAPEVAAGKQADARADLYSLGATFYHVLAGQPPFLGSSATELALKHTRENVPPLAQKAPEAPAALCRLIHRLLRKNPAERYPSATDVLAALDRAEQRAPSPQDDSGSSDMEAVRASLADRREARKQRQRTLVLVGGCSAAAAVLAVALVLLLSRRGGQPPADQGRVVAVTPPPPAPAPAPAPAADQKGKATDPLLARYLAKAEEKVAALLGEQRYGEAIDQYDAILERYDDAALRKSLQEKSEAIRKQADEAYRQVEANVRDLVGKEKFSEAYRALLPVLEKFRTREQVELARTLRAEIESAEKRQNAAKAKTATGTVATKADDEARLKAEEEARAKAEAAERAEAERRRQLEARYAQALQPAEALVKAWNFAGAAEALKQVAFDEEALAARLDVRRHEVDLLARLKAKMIAKINGSNPPLRKSTLLIPGVNADLAKADQAGISANLGTQGTEGHPWKSLSSRTARLLVQLVADSKDADDCVASGLLALVCGDVAAAQKSFEAASALGAAVEPYLAPIAATALAEAVALADKQSFVEALDALTALEAKYGKTPWFAEHKEAIEAARQKAHEGGAEAAAEKLYQQAAKHFAQKEFFELKPLIERLRNEFTDTQVVTDTKRKPTVDEMAEATGKLGKVLTVRQDGGGDHKTIQAAIDAAPANSIIVIADSGTYGERLLIPKDKQGLTLKGKKGCWPILGSDPTSKRVFRRLLDVEAPDVTVERIVFSLRNVPENSSSGCIEVTGGGTFHLRSSVLYSGGRYGYYLVENSTGVTEMDHCIIAQSGSIHGRLALTNTISLGAYLYCYGGYYSSTRVTVTVGDPKAQAPAVGCKLANCAVYRVEITSAAQVDCCTFPGGIQLRGESIAVNNTIMGQVSADKPDTKIDYCTIFGKNPFVEFARPGPHCMTRNPFLISAKGFDYRLKPGSPCRKRASDGGDMGCRYTREMREMFELALALRQRGIIDFAPITDTYDY